MIRDPIPIARVLSVVMPALDEQENIEGVIATIPSAELNALGWDVEILVVDNGSTDRTAPLAVAAGARVVSEPVRGYGNAYKAGLAAARGDVIATGDADLTYPFGELPSLLKIFDESRLDFLTTNRLHSANRSTMKLSHFVGNYGLSLVSKVLFRSRFRDSQSGMWVFRRHVWEQTDVRSSGMGFSQEIKNEAWMRGFRCSEVPIQYRPRGGVVKLNAGRDGLRNLAQLISHRCRRRRLREGIAVALLAPTVIDLATGIADLTPAVIDLRDPRDIAAAHQSVQRAPTDYDSVLS